MIFEIPITIEEIGESDFWLEVIASVDYEPSEPAVMYYRDGSGYPGCPETLDMFGFKVTEYGTERHGVKREVCIPLFEALDALAKFIVESDSDEHYLNNVRERIYEQFDD